MGDVQPGLTPEPDLLEWALVDSTSDTPGFPFGVCGTTVRRVDMGQLNTAWAWFQEKHSAQPSHWFSLCCKEQEIMFH